MKVATNVLPRHHIPCDGDTGLECTNRDGRPSHMEQYSPEMS